MLNIFITEYHFFDDNKFKALFNLLMKYFHEIGLFNKKSKDPMKPAKIPTEQLWAILIEKDKNNLVKVLQRVESKEAGYGSIVVPEKGFTNDDKINAMILSWLKERDVNVIDVKEEVKALESSLMA